MKIWQHKSFTIHAFDELESTNDKAFTLHENKEIFDKSVVTANTQTKGRGRQNRQWSSPAGNLYFSLLLTNNKNSTNITAQLSFVAAVAMRDALAEILENSASQILLKWPNDILLDEEKICGILLENKINSNGNQTTVIGIGLNNTSHPANTIFPATSLQHFNITISNEELLQKFLNHFDLYFANWQQFGFKKIRNSYLKNTYKLGKEIAVRSNIASNKFIIGTLTDIDLEGNLLLDQQGKIIKIFAGELASI